MAKYELYVYDEKKGVKSQYVDVARPIQLGFYIGIGFVLGVITLYFIVALIVMLLTGIAWIGFS